MIWNEWTSFFTIIKSTFSELNIPVPSFTLAPTLLQETFSLHCTLRCWSVCLHRYCITIAPTIIISLALWKESLLEAFGLNCAVCGGCSLVVVKEDGRTKTGEGSSKMAHEGGLAVLRWNQYPKMHIFPFHLQLRTILPLPPCRPVLHMATIVFVLSHP